MRPICEGEIAVEALHSFKIDGMRLLGGRIVPEVYFSASLHNLGAIAVTPVILINATKACSISFPALTICAIFEGRGFSQVGQLVIQSIAIPVVNEARRPRPIMVKPDNPVKAKALISKLDSIVSVIGTAPSDRYGACALTDEACEVRGAHLPCNLASLSIVVQDRTNILLGDELFIFCRNDRHTILGRS